MAFSFSFSLPPLSPDAVGRWPLWSPWVRNWRQRLARDPTRSGPRPAQRRTRGSQASSLERAALEACAVEGSELRYGQVVIDGRRYAALFRRDELVGLLPEDS